MKVIRVDMTHQTITEEPLPAEYAGLGGRGLTSTLINAEVPAACDPLGPENKLVFAPGYLSGTTLVNTSRFSVGAKSPLTGGIKESNVGGTVAADLARLGITAVVVEGQAPAGSLYLLKIDAAANAQLIDAAAHKGMRTYGLVKEL
ncbi:MAG TPA: aldehyde ferredoxin oxidoreductase N-terminal domain-containing protein, partial [Desulfobacterales bacterium]|nr:aldehyde ferredoxin oxidoreductase N-terminal domain-containing protein [Desulfobacterales bacterium]